MIKASCTFTDAKSFEAIVAALEASVDSCETTPFMDVVHLSKADTIKPSCVLGLEVTYCEHMDDAVSLVVEVNSRFQEEMDVYFRH